MAVDDHEKEQDEYLRGLGERTKKAEAEARDALLILADCHDQNRKLVLLSILISLVCMILAATLSYFIYGH